VGFVEDDMACSLESSACQIQVADVQVGRSVSKENTVEGVPIKFGWAFARDLGSNTRAEGAKVSEVGALACV
jgi:hypothetical protein